MFKNLINLEKNNKVAAACVCLAVPDSSDCSHPGSSVRGIFQARVLDWFTLQRIFLTQGSTRHLLCLLYWQADFFLPLSHLGTLKLSLPVYNLENSHRDSEKIL